MTDKPTAPATWHIDPTPYDAPEGFHDTLPADAFPADVHGQAMHARATAHNGSPHVIERLTCTSCSRTATYYGRADNAPDRDTWTCDQCP